MTQDIQPGMGADYRGKPCVVLAVGNNGVLITDARFGERVVAAEKLKLWPEKSEVSDEDR